MIGKLIIEILILWIIYALYMAVLVHKRGPLGGIFFYPKVVQERVIEIGLMTERELKIGFPYPHKHIAYKHMSHAVLTRLPWIYKMAFKSERQHPKDCAKDREALKTELLDWVNNAWR